MVLSIEQIQAFLLILVRVAALTAAIPFLGGQVVPRQLKVGFVVFLSLVLFPVVPVETGLNLIALLSGMVGEFMIGMVIGLASRLVFAAVELAGELIGFQIGFGIVNVIDPITSVQTPVIAQFQGLLAILIFLIIDAHHHFIMAITFSFRLIPPLQFHLDPGTFQALVRLASEVFVLAMKIAAPVMVTLLLTNIALGIVARAAPQMNILVVSFPLTIGIGLLVLGLSLPWFVLLLQKAFNNLRGNTLGLLQTMGYP